MVPNYGELLAPAHVSNIVMCFGDIKRKRSNTGSSFRTVRFKDAVVIHNGSD